MPVARHYNLRSVRQQLQKSKDRAVAIILIGDSRSTTFNNRVIGGIRRTWPLQHAGLLHTASAGNVGIDDGMGEAPINLAPNASSSNTPPGDNTIPGTSLINLWPIAVAQQLCTPTAPGGMFGTTWTQIRASSAGHAMKADAAGTSGGTFALGDPAQGRNITRVKMFYMRDDQAGWLQPSLHVGYTTPAWIGGSLTTLGPGDADGSLLKLTWDGPGTTGTDFRVSLGVDVNGNVFANKRLAWFGIEVEYEGRVGILPVSVSQGGWNTRSHLWEDVYTEGDNTFTDVNNANGAKYTDDKAVEFLQTMVDCGTAVLRIEIGANIATGGDFNENPGGGSIGAYKENVRMIIQRWKAICATAGVSDVVVELVSVWQANGAGDTRTPQIQAALAALAREETSAAVPVAFYDQYGALIDAGMCIGNSVKDEYLGNPVNDRAHQGFDGMVAFQRLEWAAIQSGDDEPYEMKERGRPRASDRLRP